MTTLPMNGVWYRLVTGTGSGIKHHPTTVPTTGNSWLGCSCFRSQSRLFGTNAIVGLCDQEPVKTFQKGRPPEKAKLKQCSTYLSQFRLTAHHIQGIKNEMAHYISRNNFNALLGESSEALAKEAFQRMDVQLDLSMRTAGVLEGWSLRDYHAEYKCVLNSLSDGLEARLIDGDHWYKDNQYLYYEDRMVVREAQLDGCLQWAHLSFWANRVQAVC